MLLQLPWVDADVIKKVSRKGGARSVAELMGMGEEERLELLVTSGGSGPPPPPPPPRMASSAFWAHQTYCPMVHLELLVTSGRSRALGLASSAF